jgi:hypothetical protein
MRKVQGAMLRRSIRMRIERTRHGPDDASMHDSPPAASSRTTVGTPLRRSATVAAMVDTMIYAAARTA